MRFLIPLLLMGTLAFSACSDEEVQEKVEEYSKLTVEDLAVQLAEDSVEGVAVTAEVARCQAEAIDEAGLQDKLNRFLATPNGKTVIERAQTLSKPKLVRALQACADQA